MIIFYPNRSMFDVSSWTNMKKQGLQNSHFALKSRKRRIHLQQAREANSAYSLIANHVLEMSVKLKFKCVCFKKKHCFALVVLNRFSICFYQGLFTRCHLYHRILLYYYAETNEMIYESVNLKGVVYEPKQNSFSLQTITIHTGFTNVGAIFYKVHSLSCEQVFNCTA